MTDEDNTLTPLEVFVAGHALDRAIAEFGDDAVLRSARDKLDRTLQNVQAIDPKVAEQIQTHVAMMKPAESEPQPPEGSDFINQPMSELFDSRTGRCPRCGGKHRRPVTRTYGRWAYCTHPWHDGR